MAIAPLALSVAVLVWAAGRGLDFTDEGMYLLSARTGDKTASFHNAYGSYTGVLLAAVGHDIVRFRLLGLFLVCTVGALTGASCVRAGERLAGAGSHSSRSLTHGEVASSAALGAGGFLQYYALMLMTPSYNLLNLVGLGLMLSGFVVLATRIHEIVSASRRVLPTTAIVVGTAVAAMGKISSLAVGLGFSLVLLVFGWRTRMTWRLMVLLGVEATVWLLGHHLFVNSISVTWSQIKRGQESLVLLDPTYGLSAAFGSFTRDGWQLLLTAMAISAVVIPVFVVASRGRKDRRQFLRTPTVGVVLILSSTVLWHVPNVLISSQPDLRSLSQIAVSLTVLAVSWRLTCAIRAARGDNRHERSARWKARTVLVGLSPLVCAVGYAFGSNNGFGVQLAGGSGLLLCGAALAISSAPVADPSTRSQRQALLSVGSIVVCCLALSTVTDAVEHPYRQAPLRDQRQQLDLGAWGALAVDVNNADAIGELRAIALRSGWQPRTMLVDLSAYAATVLVALDATPPQTIIPSVCCYSGQDSLARFSLRHERQHGSAWQSAWLLTIDRPADTGVGLDVLDEWDRSITDYERVGTVVLQSRVETLSLWRPLR